MPLQTNELTLHIALATIPRNQELAYPKRIQENFYDDYIRQTNENYKNSHESYFKDTGNQENNKTNTVNILYNPLKYYIFGNYDIAFISLVDSYKFAQKLFTPKSKSDENNKNESEEDIDHEVLNPHSFQVLTGMVSGQDESNFLRNFFFERLRDKDCKISTFVGICNLKINNGLLVGTGYFFYKKVLEHIKKIVSNILVQQQDDPSAISLTMQSFSWFEISLIIFSDKPERISKIITKLREQKLDNIAQIDSSDIDDIIKSSIYAGVDATNNKEDKYRIDQIMQSHIFADTHSYFGVNYDQFKDKEFMKNIPGGKLDLKAEIEWQVKPGHLANLVDIITKHLKHIDPTKEPEKYYNLKHPYLITGKTDYYIAEKESPDFGNTHKLFQIFFDEETRIYDYVKKVKTNIQFQHEVKILPENDKPFSENSPQFVFRKKLKQLAISPKQINDINSKLKALKVSRQIRSKITKVFYNYNNGILDSILFVYFTDFTGFIDSVIKLINKTYSDWKKLFSDEPFDTESSLSVKDFEDSLKKMLSDFEEAYEIRMLNCYQFEDISDFDLDFNSSIQQILTTYSGVATSVSNLFYGETVVVAPLIQLNDNTTVANYFSINYNVYHLLSPEFVFFTITKEVLNQYKRDDEYIKKRISNIIQIEKGFYSEISKDEFLAEMHVSGQIDFDYLYIDFIRFYFICNCDIKLFEYWFWMYNLQNASMYEKVGIISEEHFKKELFRLMFLAKSYNYLIGENDCPVPELQNYWDKHFYKISKSISEFFKSTEALLVIKGLKELVILKMFTVTDKQMDIKDDPATGEALYEVWKKKLNPQGPPTTILQESLTKKAADNIFFPGGNFYTILPQYINWGQCLEYFYTTSKEKFRKGQCILYDSEYKKPGMFINALMYSYLKFLYEENEGKVHLLRRNWEDGHPLKCFIESEQDDNIYSVDQTGGTFFYNPKRLNSYFKSRNSILQSLWHFAMIQKKDQVETFLKIKSANSDGK
ncbi:MAG: hypothetical protein IPN29_00810 [Saprospiraceae bacterium]|nr:hypothetical protein [Saprospiraceae bacterium]